MLGEFRACVWRQQAVSFPRVNSWQTQIQQPQEDKVMAIPTFKRWMDLTKRGIFTPRSPALKRLDKALEIYDQSKTEGNKQVLVECLDAWIEFKGGGDAWRNSTRNKHGVVTELYDELRVELGRHRVAVLKAEFSQRIRPAYIQAGYNVNGDVPGVLAVDEQDLGIEGFGSPGYVQVSMGIVNEPMRCLRIFAVAHESGHGVAYLACQNAGVVIPQTIGDGPKRHEHLADLIGMRVLMEYLREEAAGIYKNLNSLRTWLGNGDFQHPSGDRRTRLLSRLHKGGIGVFDQLITTAVNGNLNQI